MGSRWLLGLAFQPSRGGKVRRADERNLVLCESFRSRLIPIDEAPAGPLQPSTPGAPASQQRSPRRNERICRGPRRPVRQAAPDLPLWMAAGQTRCCFRAPPSPFRPDEDAQRQAQGSRRNPCDEALNIIGHQSLGFGPWGIVVSFVVHPTCWRRAEDSQRQHSLRRKPSLRCGVERDRAGGSGWSSRPVIFFPSNQQELAGWTALEGRHPATFEAPSGRRPSWLHSAARRSRRAPASPCSRCLNEHPPARSQPSQIGQPSPLRRPIVLVALRPDF